MRFKESYAALLPSLPPGQDEATHRASWDRVRCNEISNERFRYLVFEIAVREGPEVTMQLLHHALDDGITGPTPVDMKALAFVVSVDITRMYSRLVGAWQLYFLQKPEWRNMLPGSLRRSSTYLLAL